MHSLCHDRNGCSRLIFMAALVVFLSLTANAQTWPQWALNPQHTEFLSNLTGQPLNQNLVNLVYELPFAKFR